MSTSTMTSPGHDQLPSSEPQARHGVRERRHVGQFGVALAGIVAVAVSAWGGIVPYVGPLFGYGGDGSGAWHWNKAHALVALVPGAAGVAIGLFVLAELRGVSLGRGRVTLATAGLLLTACGAWFVVGPLAWPVLSNGAGAYFAAGTHMHFLADELGYSIGTGIVLIVCGAFIDGWASRHRPKAMATPPARTTSEPVHGAA